VQQRLSSSARHSEQPTFASQAVSGESVVGEFRLSAYRVGLDLGKEGAHGDSNGDLKSIPVCSWPKSGEVTPAWRQAPDVELRTDEEDSVYQL
jgi:hypothetical protein